VRERRPGVWELRHVVLTRFLRDGELAVLAATTMRETSRGRSLGDL
jgi:hypothetical protein